MGIYAEVENIESFGSSFLKFMTGLGVRQAEWASNGEFSVLRALLRTSAVPNCPNQLSVLRQKMYEYSFTVRTCKLRRALRNNKLGI